MQETKLELELKSAKTKQVIENLLCICDKIHEGFSIDGYSIDDLPPDYVYTEYCKIVNHDTNSVTKTTIMNMATIPKPEKLSILGSVLVYPKFDGCSIAIRFIKDNDVKCIYKVEYMGQHIEVFSAGNVHYQLKDYVYILLPQGDFSGKKIIISLVEPEARGVIAISAEKIKALF